MTIASETAIYNLALNAIGARNNVSSPSENSREAEVCQLWYSAVRDQILAAAPWPEATKYDYLAVSNEQEDDVWASGEAKPGYQFAYAAPTDMLHPQYLADYGRFIVTNGPSGQKLISANASQAILFYSFRNELISSWSPGLQMAVVYALASHICMPLTGKPQRANLMMGKANEIILEARAASANWNNETYDHVPEWIQGRGYSVSTNARYIYPYGGLVNVVS